MNPLLDCRSQEHGGQVQTKEDDDEEEEEGVENLISFEGRGGVEGLLLRRKMRKRKKKNKNKKKKLVVHQN